MEQAFTHEGEFVLVAEDGANDLKNYPVRCVNGRIWVNNHAHVLQGKQNFADNQFLAFSINRADIESLLVGGGRAKLNAETMMDIFLMIPSIDEQRLIGQCVSTIDNLITLHQRKCDAIKELKKGMLQKMFPKNGEKIPEVRFPGFTDDWEQRKLGEFGKATGGTSIESEFVEKGNYKVISIGSYSEMSKYNDQGLRTNKTPKTESKILNKDDLTMILNDKTAAGNIIGRVLLIDADNSYVYNQRTERIEVYKEDFEPSFLYQLLNAENIRSKIIKASQGNTQIYVNWSSISELEYLIPKVKSEQKKIATILNNLDNLITLHQRKVEKLKEMKKGLLQQMFV